MKIYLASKSPRRRELITQMGIQFDVLPIYQILPSIITLQPTTTKIKPAVMAFKVILDNLFVILMAVFIRLWDYP